MEVVWTLWRVTSLRGIYTLRGDAEAAAERLKAEQPPAARKMGIADGVRVEPWAVFNPAIQTTERGVPTRDVIDEIASKWGLISLQELGRSLPAPRPVPRRSVSRTAAVPDLSVHQPLP